jgi:hypothetical protein
MTFDAWGDFDPIEYVTRNYGKILPEDRIIIEVVIANLKKLSLDKVKHVADIGTGPNFYPAMLLASLIEEEGQIDLIEYSQPNRVFMRTLLNQSDGIYRNTSRLGKAQSIDTRKPWRQFDDLIAEIGGQSKFQHTFAKARATARSIPGDIYTLPESVYDFVSSYFVAESITNDKDECIKALASLLKAVRPGGGFMVAMMVGSKGWPAGETTHFPAVDLSFTEVQDMFDAIPGVVANATLAEDRHEKARNGYHGMAIVVGSKLSKSIDCSIEYCLSTLTRMSASSKLPPSKH